MSDDPKEPPLSDEEIVTARLVFSYFKSGRTLIRALGWLFVGVGALVATVGGLLNIIHQSGHAP